MHDGGNTSFQFTASYEADPIGNRSVLDMYAFNSQPHTRLTLSMVLEVISLCIFQFTASYEADLYSTVPAGYAGSFQFTASYEADRDFGIPFRLTHIFQFTASYEADLHHTLFHCTI